MSTHFHQRLIACILSFSHLLMSCGKPVIGPAKSKWIPETSQNQATDNQKYIAQGHTTNGQEQTWVAGQSKTIVLWNHLKEDKSLHGEFSVPTAPVNLIWELFNHQCYTNQVLFTQPFISNQQSIASTRHLSKHAIISPYIAVAQEKQRRLQSKGWQIRQQAIQNKQPSYRKDRPLYKTNGSRRPLKSSKTEIPDLGAYKPISFPITGYHQNLNPALSKDHSSPLEPIGYALAPIHTKLPTKEIYTVAMPVQIGDKYVTENRQVGNPAPWLSIPIFSQEGHQVRFQQDSSYWRATVEENCVPGFSRSFNLPVLNPIYEKIAGVRTAIPYSIEHILGYPPILQRQFIHIVLPKKGMSGGYVYTGPIMGLLGGGNQSSKGEGDVKDVPSGRSDSSTSTIIRPDGSRVTVTDAELRERFNSGNPIQGRWEGQSNEHNTSNPTYPSDDFPDYDDHNAPHYRDHELSSDAYNDDGSDEEKIDPRYLCDLSDIIEEINNRFKNIEVSTSQAADQFNRELQKYSCVLNNRMNYRKEKSLRHGCNEEDIKIELSRERDCLEQIQKQSRNLEGIAKKFRNQEEFNHFIQKIDRELQAEANTVSRLTGDPQVEETEVIGKATELKTKFQTAIKDLEILDTTVNKKIALEHLTKELAKLDSIILQFTDRQNTREKVQKVMEYAAKLACQFVDNHKAELNSMFSHLQIEVRPVSGKEKITWKEMADISIDDDMIDLDKFSAIIETVVICKASDESETKKNIKINLSGKISLDIASFNALLEQVNQELNSEGAETGRLSKEATDPSIVIAEAKRFKAKIEALLEKVSKYTTKQSKEQALNELTSAKNQVNRLIENRQKVINQLEFPDFIKHINQELNQEVLKIRELAQEETDPEVILAEATRFQAQVEALKNRVIGYPSQQDKSAVLQNFANALNDVEKIIHTNQTEIENKKAEIGAMTIENVSKVVEQYLEDWQRNKAEAQQERGKQLLEQVEKLKDQEKKAYRAEGKKIVVSYDQTKQEEIQDKREQQKRNLNQLRQLRKRIRESIQFDQSGYSSDETFDLSRAEGGTRMPSSIVLDNKKAVKIIFGVSESDNRTADNLVNPKLIKALEQILNLVSQTIDVQEIYIKCTTNGQHSLKSNHKVYQDARAIDISRINGKMIKALGSNHPWVKLFQEAMEQLANIRENFGPCFLHKEKKVHKLPNPKDQENLKEAHQNHIHFSINP